MSESNILKEGLSRAGSILFIAFFLVSSMFMFVIAFLIKVVTMPFDKRLTVLHWYSCLWATMYLWTMPAWSVDVIGREKIDRKKVYVIVSNHQSLVDILVGFRLFVHFKWVAKIELLKVPFVGWNMRLNKYIILKRGDRQSILEMMKDSEANLKQGSSVYIYPEGTRSKTGEMGEFKAGAFALAKRTGVPLLPIAIVGSKDALPKNSLTIRGWHRIKIVVLDEIGVDVVANEEPRALARMARDQIKEVLVESELEGG